MMDYHRLNNVELIAPSTHDLGSDRLAVELERFEFGSI